MKQKAKKAASTDKMEKIKTGGGTFISQVDTVDEKILALLGNRAVPLHNPYDADAQYNNEIACDDASAGARYIGEPGK